MLWMRVFGVLRLIEISAVVRESEEIWFPELIFCGFADISQGGEGNLSLR